MASPLTLQIVQVVRIAICVFSLMFTYGSGIVKMKPVSDHIFLTTNRTQRPSTTLWLKTTQPLITKSRAHDVDIPTQENRKHENTNTDSEGSTSNSNSVIKMKVESSNFDNWSEGHEEVGINKDLSCFTNYSDCLKRMNDFLNFQMEIVSSEISTAAILYNGSSDILQELHTVTMVATTQNVSKPSQVLREVPLLSSSTRLIISRYFALVVNPIIGIVGLTTNIISCIVIVRSGLRKPSNIFLLSLAISDWVCTLRSVNVGWLLTYLRHKLSLKYIGWEMSYINGFICHAIDKTIVRLSNFAAGMSTSITVLITIERFIATYFPLKFALIVTPSRAWVALISTVLLLLPPYTFKLFFDEYGFMEVPEFNSSLGFYVQSQFYKDSLNSMNIFEMYFVIHFEFSLPLTIVIVGCILISAKVSYFRRKHQTLVQRFSKSTKGNIRTTNTLLMVCLLYSLTRLCYLFVYLPIFDETKARTRNVSYLFVDIRWTLVQVNSACNIVVYVLFNPKFKRILKGLFLPVNPRNGSA